MASPKLSTIDWLSAASWIACFFHWADVAKSVGLAARWIDPLGRFSVED
jgi:hypothetical protein